MIKRNKGVALMMVLGVILVVVIFTNIILNFILSQSRLTHHQIGRIQAYYAAMGAVNFALDRLRLGTYISGTHCTPASPCNNDNPPATATNLYNLAAGGSFRPASVQDVSIVIRQPTAGTLNCDTNVLPVGTSCVEVTSTYTTPQ